MRPYTKYLEYLKDEDLKVKYHLGGSTPPIPQTVLRKSIKLKLDSTNYAAQVLAVKKDLAKKASAKTEEISLVPGSTQACFQVLAAISNPGDTIILEHPVYEPYVATAEFLGLKIKRFQRSRDLDSDFKELKKLSLGAQILLISNPHCPTGWTYSYESMRKLADLNLQIVIDEVFLPLFANGQISHRPNLPKKDNLIFLSGLTKSIGFGLQRCGWVIGSPEVSKKVDQIGFILHSDFPSPLLPVMGFALKNWREINKYALKMSDGNRALVKEFYEKHPGMLSHDFVQSFFGMIKVPENFPSGAEFVKELLKKDILLRDGSFFEMPQWVRFHTMLPPKDFKKAFGTITGYY